MHQCLVIFTVCNLFDVFDILDLLHLLCIPETDLCNMKYTFWATVWRKLARDILRHKPAHDMLWRKPASSTLWCKLAGHNLWQKLAWDTLSCQLARDTLWHKPELLVPRACLCFFVPWSICDTNMPGALYGACSPEIICHKHPRNTLWYNTFRNLTQNCVLGQNVKIVLWIRARVKFESEIKIRFSFMYAVVARTTFQFAIM